MRRRSEAGYTLVMLAAVITVLSVLAAAALPAWSKLIRRQKEEELIFRGLQYAEAIRVFELRQGRLPTHPKELFEVRPRAIRQLWRNPLADDGAWLLLPATQDLPDDAQGRRPRPGALRWAPPERLDEPDFTPQTSLPFVGVASPVGETAAKTFLGSNEVREWRFTVDLVKGVQGAAPGFSRPVNSGSFWRPFPPDVLPPLPDRSQDR